MDDVPLQAGLIDSLAAASSHKQAFVYVARLSPAPIPALSLSKKNGRVKASRKWFSR